MNVNHHIYPQSGVFSELLSAMPFFLALTLYIFAARFSGRSYKQWPLSRIVFWGLGIFCAAAAVIGPLADRAHADFTAHMLGHLLLGMLAPLFIVLSAPMTLFLRTLPVHLARCFTAFFKSRLIQVLSDPIIASFFNIGGLWILYTTSFYSLLQQNIWLHAVIHAHVFFAGYLFTASILCFDLTLHRTSFLYRSIVLMIALAGHGILAKYIYAHPPGNVSEEQAQIGGMLMYYGGDAVDLLLICLLCFQWFKSTRPRTVVS